MILYDITLYIYMGHSTETYTFGTTRCLKIYIYFLHLNLGHIIRLPFDFMNTCKRQLNYYYYLEFLCNYFKTTCIIFVTGVAFFTLPSSLCWPTTAHRHTTLTFSSSLRMTRLWWVSLATEMRQTTGVRWAAWLGGAGSTFSLWMWRRQRRLLLISGKCTLSMLLWPSPVRLWSERAAPSFWVCTSQRTSPGLTTLQHWPRKHSNVSTSSANSEEPEPWPPSCALSTEAPSRASWLASSLCGMAPATRPAASPFNG